MLGVVMNTHPIGHSALESTRLVYGVMRTAGGKWFPDKVTAEDREAGVKAILAAYEAGYNHFDTADIYCRGVCDEILAQAMERAPDLRGQSIITTKCGIRFEDEPPGTPKTFDHSREWIIESVEGSLKRLKIDVIDLLLLHRPDALLDPHEVASAFGALRKSGKVRCFGVSNFTPSQVLMLTAHVTMPIVANQVRFHPGHIDPLNDGTLDQCLELSITPMAYSPVGGGQYATGTENRAKDDQKERVQATIDVLDQVAGERGVSRTVVTLAWLLRHPAGVLPVVGTTNPDRIRESVAADDLDLSREDWYRIFVAARGAQIP